MVDISLPTTEEERYPLETLREVILSIVKVMLPWQDGAEMAEDEWEFNEELLDEVTEVLAAQIINDLGGTGDAALACES